MKVLVRASVPTLCLTLILLFRGSAAGQDFSPSKFVANVNLISRGNGADGTVRPYPLQVPVILGAPFSAEERAERHEVLLDGTHIDQIAEPARIWRDSAGRTRVEWPPFHYTIPPTRGFPSLVEIFDPSTSSLYLLDSESQVVHRMSVKSSPVQPVDPKKLEATEVSAEHRLEAAHMSVRVEVLGFQTIEGLVCFGKRTTATRDLGQEEPLTSVTEVWYSIDLQAEVLYKTPDRTSLDNLRTLVNVVRAEPAAALFQLPAGYAVLDETGPFKINLTRR